MLLHHIRKTRDQQNDGAGFPLDAVRGFSLQNKNITIGSAGSLPGGLPFHCTTAGDIFCFNDYFVLAFVTLKNTNWS